MPRRSVTVNHLCMQMLLALFLTNTDKQIDFLGTGPTPKVKPCFVGNTANTSGNHPMTWRDLRGCPIGKPGRVGASPRHQWRADKYCVQKSVLSSPALRARDETFSSSDTRWFNHGKIWENMGNYGDTPSRS